MKKILSILLVVVMLSAIALPAFAEGFVADFEVDPNVIVPALGAETMKDEIIDKDTGEVIGYGPEWTYYPWYNYCYVLVTQGGESRYMRLSALADIASGGTGSISGGVWGDQSADAPWEVGGTYETTYYLFEMDTGDTVMEIDLNVTLAELPIELEISKIVVDELATSDRWEETYYDWEQVGHADITVDGTKYENITLNDLREILQEEYGQINYSHRGREGFEQSQNPWKVGESYEAVLDISSESMYLFSGAITVEVCETNIASVAAKPMSYYVYEGSKELELIATYKDGTTGPCPELQYVIEGDYPEEPGTHTLQVKVANTFTVPLEITVLPNPTSGKMGEKVEWKFDATTSTLTLSGTGDTYYVNENPNTTSDEFDDWLNNWLELFRSLHPKHIVVEEGITGLMPGIFMFAFATEDITLPNSLKAMPFALMGVNGASEEVELGVGIETKGVTTLVIPKNITQWKQNCFYDCWGVKEFYLPAGIASINIDNLVYVTWWRQRMELPEQETKIHFAGTKAQWDAIEFLAGGGNPEENPYDTEWTLEEAKAILNTFVITYEDPAESYKEDVAEDDTTEEDNNVEQKEQITVDNGVASVPDSVVDIQQGKDVVIDLTESEKAVDAVVIKPETVDKITNAQTAVQVKLPAATVSFDKTAIGTIGQKAGQAEVTILAKEVEKTTLAPAQKEALEKKEVLVCLSLEALAGQTKIIEFGGGKVTVSVPITLPAGKTGEDFVAAHVADNGRITPMPTTYADGELLFETTHFSNYVVVEKSSLNDNPKTGDNAMLALPLVLLGISLAGAVCITKRRVF